MFGNGTGTKAFDLQALGCWMSCVLACRWFIQIRGRVGLGLSSSSSPGREEGVAGCVQEEHHDMTNGDGTRPGERIGEARIAGTVSPGFRYIGGRGRRRVQGGGRAVDLAHTYVQYSTVPPHLRDLLARVHGIQTRQGKAK